MNEELYWCKKRPSNRSNLFQWWMNYYYLNYTGDFYTHDVHEQLRFFCSKMTKGLSLFINSHFWIIYLLQVCIHKILPFCHSTCTRTNWSHYISITWELSNFRDGNLLNHSNSELTVRWYNTSVVQTRSLHCSLYYVHI